MEQQFAAAGSHGRGDLFASCNNANSRKLCAPLVVGACIDCSIDLLVGLSQHGHGLAIRFGHACEVFRE